MQILLVGLYDSIEALVREEVDAKAVSPPDWTSTQTAPQALLLVRGENGQDYDIVVVAEDTRGTAPSVQWLVRDLSASAPKPRLIAVGHTREDCEQLLAAGCERWCRPQDLAEVLKALLASSGRVAS